MSLRKNGFLPYNKSELFEKINAIEIFQEGTNVITKYFGRVIKTTKVSNIYEIFDISTYLKTKIEEIENNFNISNYRFIVRGGVQELSLLSEETEINDTNYYKSFFILNSSDKSRRLNINLGLYRSDNNSYFVSSINNMSVSRKHLRGVTKIVEDASTFITVETFNDQISAIKSLIGEQVMLSKVREIIVDKDLKINHKKFDAFKNLLMNSITDRVTNLNSNQYNTLLTKSESLNLNYLTDFPIDAYKVFNCYMQVFRNQDSYVVKKETEKISKITQCFVRDEKLNQILDL